jgi:hypothetical protein
LAGRSSLPDTREIRRGSREDGARHLAMPRGKLAASPFQTAAIWAAIARSSTWTPTATLTWLTRRCSSNSIRAVEPLSRRPRGPVQGSGLTHVWWGKLHRGGVAPGRRRTGRRPTRAPEPRCLSRGGIVASELRMQNQELRMDGRRRGRGRAECKVRSSK